MKSSFPVYWHWHPQRKKFNAQVWMANSNVTQCLQIGGANRISTLTFLHVSEFQHLQQDFHVMRWLLGENVSELDLGNVLAIQLMESDFSKKIFIIHHSIIKKEVIFYLIDKIFNFSIFWGLGVGWLVGWLAGSLVGLSG